MTEEHLPRSHDVTPSGTTAPPAAYVGADEDSDPDFDDLDDVLDQFSTSSATAKASVQPTPSASGPGRPDDGASHSSTAPASSSKAVSDPSDEEFMAHLNAEMSALIANISHDPAAPKKSPEQLGQMGKELEQFTEQMEREGVKPEDLLRAILGEEDAEKAVEKAAEVREHEGKDRLDGKTQADGRISKSGPTDVVEGKSTSRDANATTTAGTATTFEDTIRRTMERISTSDATATNATSQSANSEEDMLAQLLKAMETEGGGADDGEGDLSKMFLGMMEQLTNKDMLYEPMKELDEKFPEWLARKDKEGKLAAEDMKRYRNQRGIVKEIVDKFEERGYSDDDPRCREFIWERMQRMQNEGSPPEDLIANPFPGMGGMPGSGGQGGEDAGCPTQ